MAAIDIKHVDIMRGRAQSFTVNGSSAEIVARKNIKDGIVKVTEEIKESVYEVEDATELYEQQGRKVIVEIEYSEVNTTDIQSIHNNGDEIVVATSAGGANGTGKTFTMSDCDVVKAFIRDLKTVIIAEKTVSDASTLPYTITDNT